MIAANLRRSGGIDFGNDGISFVVENEGQHTNLWVYATPGIEVCVELPDLKAGGISLIFNNDSVIQSVVKDGVLRFRLPGKASEIKYLWHVVAHYD